MKLTAVVMSTMLAVSAAVPAVPALAGDFPAHRLTLIVPYNAGGGTDGAARALAKGLGEVLKQPVIVENVGGADGLIGTQRVARSAPDGYTILLSIPNLLFFKHRSDSTFNASQSLTPLSMIAKLPVVLVASNASGIKTMDDLRKKCGAASADCSWGSGEQFTWMAGTAVLDAIKVDGAVNVPYKGTGPIVTDILGGHLTFGISSLGSPVPFHKAGQLHIVAGYAAERYPAIPDVPTMAEAGVKGMKLGEPWYGLFAPKGLPPDVLAVLEKGLKAVQHDPEVLASLSVIGAQPVFSNAAEFDTQVASDQKTFDEFLTRHPLPN